MTKPACPYTRMVEPLRDGLLTAAEREALEKHLQGSCESCEAEARYLDWIATELRRGAPAIDEVALQRQRMPLLVRAEQQRQRGFTQGQQRLGALKGALAAAVIIGLALLVFDRDPRVDVERISGHGEIRRFTEGEHNVVQLNDGRYELQVSRGVLDRSLVVRVPDGEIEDLGTAFSVTVQAGHTSRVVVTEGAVQLRLKGLPHVTLEAGGVWELREREPDAPKLSTPDLGAAGAPSTIGVAEVETPAAHAPAPEARRPAATRSKRAQAVTSAATNTEDAMYLRILDLLREDRQAAARSLAERYLKDFPEGFRRTEVLRIAEPQSPARARATQN